MDRYVDMPVVAKSIEMGNGCTVVSVLVAAHVGNAQGKWKVGFCCDSISKGPNHPIKWTCSGWLLVVLGKEGRYQLEQKWMSLGNGGEARPLVEKVVTRRLPASLGRGAPIPEDWGAPHTA